MLHLKQPAWAEELPAEGKNRKLASGSESSNSFSSTGGSSSSVLHLPSSASPPSPLIADLASSLAHRRRYRELVLALRLGLEDAQAGFSFLRVKGLRALINTLAHLSESDTLTHLFQDSQTDKTVQVVPILFKHSLAPVRSSPLPLIDPLFLDGPPQVKSPPADNEVALALRVLEGCCLLDKGSRILASHQMAVEEVIELLSAGGVLEQHACLDALTALLLDMPINQQKFLKHRGIKKVSELVKHSHVNEAMRLKCAEFLLLLVGYLLPSSSKETAEVQSSGGDSPLEQLQEHLGDVFFIVLKQVDQSSASLSSSQAREEGLQSQAELLIELIDSST